MKTYRTQYAAAAAAIGLLTAPAAHAAQLVSAYTMANGEVGLSFHDTSTLVETGGAALQQKAVGLAVGQSGGANSYYVASQGSPSNDLERYDAAGAFVDEIQYGPLIETGPVAFGAGSVFMAYESELTFSFHVGSNDPDLGVGSALNIVLPEMATGLTYGDNSLFVSYGSTLARYDLAGNLIDSHDFGVVDIGALAFGNGVVFAAFTSGSSQGWGAVDPVTFFSGGASVTTDAKINGLAFGDGGLYASFDNKLAKYDLAGNEVATYDTGRKVNGPLAFLPDSPGGVPEPGTWALMILGFGAVGTAIRRRRAAVAA